VVHPGLFYSFDGVDGAGKSTQVERFCRWLRQKGHQVVACRDPGSTALGESVRGILLGADDAVPIHRRSEMLLYMAARAQLVEEVIRPALAAGRTVVCDRFLLANIVYQGHAGGLDPEEIRRVGQVATGGIAPKLTFLLDMPAEEAARRMQRAPDRMERQGLEYLTRVRDGFLREAAGTAEKIVVIDAARDPDAVEAAIRAAVK
jgi:dTMP kinase